MKKFSMVAAVVSLFFLCGCANYMVEVNGFAEAEKPLKSNTTVYVASYSDSGNPIFDEEIRQKIEYLLKQNGYVPVEVEDKADLYLGFKLGVDSRVYTGFKEVYYPTSSAYGYYWYDNYDSYFLDLETIYDEWLAIKVYEAAPGKPAEQRDLLWVGEAVTSRFSTNLRSDVDFLLVAVFEHFGQDTCKRITIGLRNKDPRIVCLPPICAR
jgi:hypothetical protein